jgi:hypothetical protein
MTHEEEKELFAALTRLAKLMGLSIAEVDYMARMIAQADVDPLPVEEWGEPFEFSKFKISVTGDEVDFDCINAKVPEPNSQVDLLTALKQFQRDAECCANKLNSGKLTIEALVLISNNQYSWATFLAARDPNPRMRTLFAKAVVELGKLRAQNSERANAMLLRQSVVPMPQGNAIN